MTLTNLIPLALDACPAENTRRAYEQAIIRFLNWHNSEDPASLTKAVVQRYVAHLRTNRGHSTIAIALAAIRKLATEAADAGHVPQSVATGIDKIRRPRRRGKKLGQWLDTDNAGLLISAPDTATLKGKRDRVLLGLMLECGLRRDEAVTVTVDQIQGRDNRVLIVDLVGKGNRTRTIPVPWRCAAKIADWVAAAGITEGRLIRPIDWADRLNGDHMSTTAAYKQVVAYASALGFLVRPHDLRRTFGRLAHNAGAPIEQIQHTFGHSSLQTTEMYLGIQQDLKKAPCDYMDIEKEK